MGTIACYSLACFRWCLFPPETPKELLKPSHADAWKQKGEAVTWFAYVYPKVSSPDWPAKYKMVNYSSYFAFRCTIGEFGVD